MSSRLILRMVGEKLLDRTTYVLAFIVGTIINLYGQFLLPWFRGSFDPATDFLIEFEIRPDITVVSVLLGFAFPFCVGVYSAVATRYKSRATETASSLPERCPDPMFRADRDGRIVEAGTSTWQFLNQYGIDDVRKLLGRELWTRMISGDAMDDRPTVFFEPNQATYVVAHVTSGGDGVNVYMSRLPRALEAQSQGHGPVPTGR